MSWTNAEQNKWRKEADRKKESERASERESQINPEKKKERDLFIPERFIRQK